MTRHRLYYQTYPWAGRDEWLTRMGEGPPVLLVPPLFQEMNRCRAILVEAMRALADAGHAAVLPDLPGTGESPRPHDDVRWTDWTGSVASIAKSLAEGGETVLVASIRGGCLLTGTLTGPRWALSPVAGTNIARDLLRAAKATAVRADTIDSIDAQARRIPTIFAGYRLDPSLYVSLSEAEPLAPLDRTVRLASEAKAADAVLDFAPPWRQAEPRRDSALAAAIASDISLWGRRCAA